MKKKVKNFLQEQIAWVIVKLIVKNIISIWNCKEVMNL